jgi:hypothetical protein
VALEELSSVKESSRYRPGLTGSCYNILNKIQGGVEMGYSNVAGVGSCGCDKVAGITDFCKPGEFSFLLLLVLFILLASCITSGRDSNFFFIIILAVIAFGGFGRTFFGVPI